MNNELTPEQILEQNKLEADMKAFNDGLTQLIQRTGITIVAEMAFEKNGIRPVLRIGRFVNKAEDAPKEAAAPKAVKKNGKSKK